jgi:hypothetical protein
VVVFHRDSKRQLRLNRFPPFIESLRSILARDPLADGSSAADNPRFVSLNTPLTYEPPYAAADPVHRLFPHQKHGEMVLGQPRPRPRAAPGILRLALAGEHRTINRSAAGAPPGCRERHAAGRRSEGVAYARKLDAAGVEVTWCAMSA